MGQRKGGRGSKDNLVRTGFSYPPALLKILREESERRMKEMGVYGEKSWRPGARDIICVAIMLALPNINDMSIDEYKAAVKQAFNV